MDLVNRFGKMALSTQESGERTKLMAKANLSTLTEIFMMATGQMIKQTV